MPVIRTYSGDLPYQAGYKSGKTARQMYEEEKRRQDAKDQAALEFNEKKLNAEKEIEALKIMDTKEKRVQDQLNFEATLAETKRSTDALNEYRNISNQIQAMKVANQGKKPYDISKDADFIKRNQIDEDSYRKELFARIENGEIETKDGVERMRRLKSIGAFNPRKTYDA